ncbi:SixA phosphatase family protein [Kordiimonas aquimaris]|uniref:SixA phosphatase family protein n=1 Tax=Kordiimonas aquimaris TaxID=707591 RepID=UPI0021CDF9AB|nr:phosphoglycerate mutase family protein [Kordiimonas aquimaris]
MKNIIKYTLLALTALVALPAFAAEAPAIYLVRHAEKLADTDPGLTEKGIARAEALAHLMKSADLKVVYSTPYKRTMMTAKPSAEQAHLEVQSYDPRALRDFAEKLKADFNANSQSVLVVGHSNTTPVLASMLTGTEHRMLNEDEYSYLFVVRPEGNALRFDIRYFEPADH